MKSFVQFNESYRVTPETARVIGVQLGVDFSVIAPEQFAKGIDMEQEEHGGTDPITSITNDSLIMAARIAYAHLKEVPDYYDKLEKAGL